MGSVLGIGVVSADSRRVFRLVQCVHRLAVPLNGVARSEGELWRLLAATPELIIVAGVEELRWLGSERSARFAANVRAVIGVVPTGRTEDVLGAVARCATAVVVADAIDTQLPHAISHATAGMVWLPTTVMTPISRALAANPPAEVRVVARSEVSPREAEVLTLSAKGYSNREIAECLGIAVKTVETYKHRVKLRFNLSGRREMVALAEREGWLERPTPPKGQDAVPRAAAS